MPSDFRRRVRRGIDFDVASDFGHVRVRRGGKIFLDLKPYGRLYSAHGTPFQTQAQAEMVLHAIRSLIAGGVPKQVAVDRWLPRASRAHRCERWLAIWLSRMREMVDAGERAQSYLDELERWCEASGHIVWWWGDRSVHEITFSELEEWSRWLATERKLGAKTRKNVMAALHSFLSWLRQQEEIERVPPFPWPTVREHSPVLLSAESQTRVLAAIPAPKRGIFLALALLGLRPSEAMRARAADYSPGDPAWLAIPQTKNREAKRLPVPFELVDWIEAHLPRNARLSGAPLFVPPYIGRGRRAKGGWNKKTLRQVWSTACDSVGVRAKLYEGTKHSRATDLLLKGVPERVLQALLGHRDVRSTRRYARLADSALVEVMRPRGSNVAPRKTGTKNTNKNK